MVGVPGLAPGLTPFRGEASTLILDPKRWSGWRDSNSHDDVIPNHVAYLLAHSPEKIDGFGFSLPPTGG